MSAKVAVVGRTNFLKQLGNDFANKLAQNHRLLRFAMLGMIWVVAFAMRLFSIIRFESIIHEFDPWFNYRATIYLVEKGWSEFINWFDDTAWYPLGRAVGGTVYPGLMVTSATLYRLFNQVLGMPVSLRDLCVFLAPAFSGLTAISAYLLASEMKDKSAGLIAAGFMAICPGYISRSVAGSYDNESISIFQMLFTFYLWIKASKTGSQMWASAAAMFYFYMVSAWGGYAFIINLIPLHVFALLCMGRYNTKLYSSYCTFYVLGTLASMTVPFVNFNPTRTSEHMAAFGVFCLLQIVAFCDVIKGLVDDEQFKTLTKALIGAVAVIGLGGIVGLTFAGIIQPWTGRFYSLWDTGYAKKHIPIIASVSEHQPTAWSSFYFDFQWLLYLFPAGIFYCLKVRRNEHIFAILYGVTAVYFAGVMVRLILTLSPIVCVLAGIAVSALIDTMTGGLEKLKADAAVTQADIDDNDERKGEGFGFNLGNNTDSGDRKNSISNEKKPVSFDVITKALTLIPLLYHAVMYVNHSVWVTSMAYSSPSVIISSHNQATGKDMVIDDFREAYYWLRRNTAKDAKVLAWWDYGYQLAGLADRTTIVDNNTWNNNHIATVGKALSAGEKVAYETMRQVDAQYVLVLSGAISGYSGDDINKFLWMVRIAEGVYPDVIKESEFIANGFRIDQGASPTLRNSIMYKTCYYRMQELMGPNAMDRARNSQVGDANPKLSVLEEVFSSERFIMRIFKVKELDVLGRQHWMPGKLKI